MKKRPAACVPKKVVEDEPAAEADDVALAEDDEEPADEETAPVSKRPADEKDIAPASKRGKRKERSEEELEVQKQLPVLERFRAPWI